MKEFIGKYLEVSEKSLNVEQIFLNYIIALILGVVIYLSYKFSHSRAVYSARFNVSLVMLTIISTMVMNVIGSNIALSLGMVGALSIVRFRTAIKDPRDSIYIFWSIVIGICCGVNEYVVAFIGSGINFLFLLFFGSIKTNDRYLLIIHGNRNGIEEIEKSILIYYKGLAILKVKNTNNESVEYIYELTKKTIDKSKSNESEIEEMLYKINGIKIVNMICQNEETNR